MPSPSPSPEITQLVVDAASSGESTPWWAIPVVAGGFLVLGSFLSFMFGLHTDDRKAARERQARHDEEIIEAGAQLLSAGDAIRKTALKSLRRSTRQFNDVLKSEADSLLNDFSLASRRFSFVMPTSHEKDFTAYVANTIVLLVPPFDVEGQVATLDAQQKAGSEIISRIRGLRGLEPLARGSMSHRDVVALSRSADQRLRDDIESETESGGSPSS